MYIFIGPALLDSIVFLVLFAVSYGAGERGMTMAQCAWLGGIFQLTYMFGSLASGFVLNRQNARPLLLTGTLATILGAAVCFLTRGFGATFGAMAVFGVCTALFFNAFQTFMRGEAPPGGLARVTALYTLAWSTGSSFGFLGSGSLYRFGPLALIALNAAVGLIILILLHSHRGRPHEALSAEESVEQGPAGARPVQPGYVLIGWITIFTAMFVQRPLQTFYPALSARDGVMPLLAGLPLFLHMFVQGLTGLAMLRFRAWLYRRLPFVLLQTAAALVFLALWRIPAAYAATALGVALLGLWTGFAYFAAVYYAGNSGRRSRNIGVNEFLVGLGSFAGLFVSEWFMQRLGNDAVMYAVCAGTLLLSTALQWALASGRRPAPAP